MHGQGKCSKARCQSELISGETPDLAKKNSKPFQQKMKNRLEVLKPAILANSCEMILYHNHSSGDFSPSLEDIRITKRIVHASKIIGIHVHEHLIISMENEKYYSFADE